MFNIKSFRQLTTIYSYIKYIMADNTKKAVTASEIVDVLYNEVEQNTDNLLTNLYQYGNIYSKNNNICIVSQGLNNDAWYFDYIKNSTFDTYYDILYDEPVMNNNIVNKCFHTEETANKVIIKEKLQPLFNAYTFSWNDFQLRFTTSQTLYDYYDNIIANSFAYYFPHTVDSEIKANIDLYSTNSGGDVLTHYFSSSIYLTPDLAYINNGGKPSCDELLYHIPSLPYCYFNAEISIGVQNFKYIKFSPYIQALSDNGLGHYNVIDGYNVNATPNNFKICNGSISLPISSTYKTGAITFETIFNKKMDSIAGCSVNFALSSGGTMIKITYRLTYDRNMNQFIIDFSDYIESDLQLVIEYYTNEDYYNAIEVTCDAGRKKFYSTPGDLDGREPNTGEYKICESWCYIDYYEVSAFDETYFYVWDKKVFTVI